MCTRQEMEGRIASFANIYKCGGCVYVCTSILELHFHLSEHDEGGNYFYNSLLKTAYPRPFCKDVGCQTYSCEEEFVPENNRHEEELVPDSLNDVCNKPVLLQDTGACTPTNLPEHTLTQTDGADVCIKIETREHIDQNHEEDQAHHGKKAQHYIEKSVHIKKMPAYVEDGIVKNDVRNKFFGSHEKYDTHKEKGKKYCAIENKCRRKIKKRYVHKKDESNWLKNPRRTTRLTTLHSCNLKCGVDITNHTLSTEVSTLTNTEVKDESGSEDSGSSLKGCSEDNENSLKDWLDEDSGSHQKKYYCVLCNKELKSRASWEQHVEYQHYHCYTTQCEKCFHPFDDDNEIKQHNCSLAAVSVHECMQCEDKISYKYWANLLKHVKSKHKGKFPMQCEVCQRRLLSELERKRHMVKHDPALLTCMYCGKQMTSIAHLDEHINQHTGETPFHCQLCEKKFRNKRRLKEHTMYAHCSDEKLFICEKCGKTFVSSNLLRSHKRKSCAVTPFECNECDKTFRHRRSLTYHNRIHTDNRPYICHMCGDGFTHGDVLKNHIKYKHTNERPFKCSMCDKAFVKICTLQRHERVHLKVRPFACNICQKEFSTRWNLKAHLRQHTGDTPYNCSICGQGFAHNVVRKTHEAKCVMHSTVSNYNSIN